MKEEMNVMEVINEEGAVATVVEETVTNGTVLKKVLIGLGLTGLAIGVGCLVHRTIKNYKAKKAENVETEVEEIEE